MYRILCIFVLTGFLEGENNIFQMFCCKVETVPSETEKEVVIQYRESPLKVKILQSLGLKSYAINKFVFVHPPCKYKFSSQGQQKEGKITISEVEYMPPFGYNMHCFILRRPRVSIPIVHLKPSNIKAKSVIIFSQGNGSDLSQCMDVLCSLAQIHNAEYIAYDYSGYGQSELKDTNSQTICDDLQTIIAWLDRPLSQIILMGFSLGCYPTAKMASMYKVKGVVLISPMMSLISLLAGEEKLAVNSFFKEDQFSTFEVVENIQSHLLIMHSRDDQFIPFRHAELIYQRYTKLSKNPSVHLVQVQDILHNDLLKYLTVLSENGIKKEFLAFLQKTEQKEEVDYYILKRSKRLFLKKNAEGSAEVERELRKELEVKRRQKQKNTGIKLSIIRNQIALK